MIKRLLLHCSIALSFLVVLCSSSNAALAAERVRNLFVPRHTVVISEKEKRDLALTGKNKVYRINIKALAAGKFSVTLPSGVKLIGINNTRKNRTKSQKLKETYYLSNSYTGKLFSTEGEEAGEFIISINQQRLGKPSVNAVFNVTQSGQAGFNYVLNTDGTLRKFELITVDPKKLPGCAEALHDQIIEGDKHAHAEVKISATTSDSDLKLMLVYSPQAETAVGGQANMLSWINTAVSLANTSYNNSGVKIKLTLVHVAKLAQDELAFADNLYKMTNYTDGYFDEIGSLRTQYGADLVSMIVNATQYCGIGWLPSQSWIADASNGHSVTYWGCINNHTMTHEMGHNMGAAHDADNAGGSGYFPSSKGYRFYVGPTQYRSIMAYAPGTRVGYFSGPNTFYNGVATGNSNADNVSTLNTTRSYVETWAKDPGPTPTPTVSPTPTPTFTPSAHDFEFIIKDASGKALSGAKVTISDGTKKFIGFTDTNGRAVISGIYTYKDYTVNVSAAGLNFEALSGKVSGAQSFTLNGTVRTYRIEVNVVSSVGAPLPGALVTSELGNKISDAEGKVFYDNVAHGTVYAVEGSLKGYARSYNQKDTSKKRTLLGPIVHTLGLKRIE